jgi:hypothetical protein
VITINEKERIMNVKYSNKVVVKKAFEIPAREFNLQMDSIKFNVGVVLWKYNGKYNKRCPALVKGGLEWGASWCESGYVIPMEYLEIVSELS